MLKPKVVMLKAKIVILIKMILELITIASISVNISVGCLIFSSFFKLKYIFQNIKINAEDLSRQYLGRELQLSDIDRMTPQELDKLYCRYEAWLGASMIKTLGNSFINLYVMGVSKYFNVINPPKLSEDLEDPFINYALTSICCELYYKNGIIHSNVNNCKTLILTKITIPWIKMETQEIPEAQEPQKTQEPKTEEPQTEGPQKSKEPKTCAAGKKMC